MRRLDGHFYCDSVHTIHRRETVAYCLSAGNQPDVVEGSYLLFVMITGITNKEIFFKWTIFSWG
jgi:hypothetical protein